MSALASARTALVSLFLALMLAFSLFGAAVAQQPPAGRDAAEAVRIELDQLEAAFQRRLDPAALNDLRRRVDPLRDRLGDMIAEQEPRLAEIRDRLTQLGPAPAENAPPESAEIRAQRTQLTRSVSDINARIVSLKVLQTRADQVSDRITERRRQLFTAELLERTTSVADPRFWSDLTAAAPRIGRTSHALITDWWGHLATQVGRAGLIAAGALGALTAGCLIMAYRALRRRGLYANPADVPDSELAKALAALRVAAERATVMPLLVGIGLAIIVAFELVPLRAQSIVPAIMAAALIIAATRGIMQGVLAPGVPAYRLVDLSDRTAEALYQAARHAAWIVATGVLCLAVARIIVAPVVVTMLITGLTALALVTIAVRFLLQTSTAPTEPEAATDAALQAFGWIRPALWILSSGLVIALIGGYFALASFAASRFAAALVIAAATVLVLRLLDTLIAEWFGASTARGRSIAASLGMRPERLELFGTLIAGALRVVILIGSALIVFGPWGFGGVGAAIDDAVVGLRFGEIRALVLGLLGAAAVLIVGLLLLRAIQRWVREEVLPRSGLDAGLQNSVSTIFGYAGIALVIGLGLRQLGLDLSNIAIVAGALSVGIGFGLQSIVSNFVSGLILLAERPIRVGDSIVVRGEEGHVKKISVRSTEIETFERATVIVPNSELITGVVKNWTHSNTQGRIIIPVRVAYDSDADAVRSQLIGAAAEQEHIVKLPPPRVYLMRFGDAGLEFELRVIVSNVDLSLSVKSELQLSILRRFREAGIIIAPPEQRVQTARAD